MGNRKSNDNLLYGIGAAGIAIAGIIILPKLFPPGEGEELPTCPSGQIWDGTACVIPPVPVGSIQLSASRIQVAPNEPVTLTAIVRDEANRTMSGVTVYVFVDGAAEGLAGVSDTAGKLVFDLSFSNEGTYSVWVSDQQDGS